MQRYSAFILCLALAQASLAQNFFPEGAQHPDVRTPLAYPEGNPTGYPFIALNSGQFLSFHFDKLGTDRIDYRYAVIHCDHNWIETDLESSEYIRGFNQLQITDMEASFGTQRDFVHYHFDFPNDMMQPTISGNYAVVVFEGMNPAELPSRILIWRIVVYESQVRFRAKMQQSSVVRDRFTHHEILCEIIPDTYRIPDPNKELNLSVLQNGDWNHAVNDLKPTFIKPDAIAFQYSDGRMSFPAGNEWRDFEMKDLRFNGINVANVMPGADGYHVLLRPGIPTGGRGAHETRQDLNGRSFVRSDIASDSHLEAEYVMVHFTLQLPQFTEGEVHIEGGPARLSNEPWIMTYDTKQGAYTGAFLVKQGFHNYRYVVYDRYHPGGDISLTEGNFTNTENDYHILVYHYDRAIGADRVVGIQPLNSHR